ncbi:hypothetical protein GYMLUDRAFT_61671 [Collybiopsis luxurians FD-317 M1]|uniref:Uncharacterized protein n=1 Tax=Collybiopsis luxurians FD-317 M1 TaxID=944289 RepID=A0A0D0CG33_9AGAR|nr:hypothetical protein GYMLUDRAFT_61671 [Collybiopsis luxurians FD-317 M1]
MDTLIGSDSKISLSKSNRPPLSRPAGRQTPLGPRTRQQSAPSYQSFDSSSNGTTSHRNSTLSGVSSHSRESTLYSSGPSSPSFPPPISPLRSEYDPQALPDIEELPADPIPSESNPKLSSRTPSVILHKSPSFSSTSSPIPSREPSPAPPSITSSPATNLIRVIPKPAVTLIPPPPIKFENVQVAWKGLPLEAAQFSRAIRSSASESFIRLLSLRQLDETLPAELERLASQKASMQARYRFHVQRRTMLLQALMSFTAATSAEKDGGVDLIGKLATQISDTTAECDRLTQELVSVTDQMSQITKLIENHWASALAIALRKLNGSYGKRTAELIQTKTKVEQLQAELNDAWTEAEKLAKEMDNLDETGIYYSDEDEDIMIQKAAVVSLPQAPVQDAVSASGKLIDLKPTLNHAATSSEASSSRPSRPLRTPPAIPDERVPDVPQSAVDRADDDDDAFSVKSKRSARSVRSEKSFGGSSRVSLVTAARTRSVRASLGSLRLPGHRKKISLLSPTGSRSAQAEEPHPPVPAIPKVFSPASSQPPSTLLSASPSPSNPNPSSSVPSTSPSFLNLESGNASLVSLVDEPSAVDNAPPVPTLVADPQPPPRPRRTEIDDIRIEPNRYLGDGANDSLAEHDTPLSVMDDIIVMPQSSGRGMGEDSSPFVFRKSVDDEDMTANSRRKLGRDQASSSIPSIWLNADAPKTPAERVEALMRSRSSGSKHHLSSLKGLTKRYSLPFPFPGKTSASNKSVSPT